MIYRTGGPNQIAVGKMKLEIVPKEVNLESLAHLFLNHNTDKSSKIALLQITNLDDFHMAQEGKPHAAEQGGQ